MIRAKQIIGKQVINIDTGEKLSPVAEILFDYKANAVLGIIIKEGGWLIKKPETIPFVCIKSIGEDAIMVSREDKIDQETESYIRELSKSEISLVGMNLMTTEGEIIGKITDIVFNKKTGQVEGYYITEVSQGHFSLFENQKEIFLDIKEKVQVGKDVAIIPAEANSIKNLNRKKKKTDSNKITAQTKNESDQINVLNEELENNIDKDFKNEINKDLEKSKEEQEIIFSEFNYDITSEKKE